MDEIQDCIADAQFGEVLRAREQMRPTMRIPQPPDSLNFDQFASERGIDLEYTVSQPIGVYLIIKSSPEHTESFQFLAELAKFRKLENPDMKEYLEMLNAAKLLPGKYDDKVKVIRETISMPISSDSDGSIKFVRKSFASSSDENKKASSSDENNKDEKKCDNTVDVNDIDITDVSDTGECGEADDEDPSKMERIKIVARCRTENKLFVLELFDSVKDVLLKDLVSIWEVFVTSPHYLRFLRLMWYAELPIEYEHFHWFRDLGRGAYGVVAGAKLRTTGSLHALKCMNKKLVKGKNALTLVKAERQVLAKLGEVPSRFTVYLQYAFSDKDTFYLALPLCTGGDLLFHLTRKRFFQPDEARYHIAEVVLGIAHLHSLGIVYRDLKPDNILLDEEGHCRISDMGLAVITGGRFIRGRAGTPGYWPPEMILKQRYTYSADWWCLGCVLYELLSGRCPFSKANTHMERDEATLNWPVTFPQKIGGSTSETAADFPEDAKAIILKLLDRNKATRLGAGERGADEIKDDPYFDSIQWKKLLLGQIEPPWKPHKEIINAFNQSDIDGRSNEYDYRKLKLTEQDEIPNFAYTSSMEHQENIVRVLVLEDEGKLNHLSRGDIKSCCNIA